MARVSPPAAARCPRRRRRRSSARSRLPAPGSAAHTQTTATLSPFHKPSHHERHRLFPRHRRAPERECRRPLACRSLPAPLAAASCRSRPAAHDARRPPLQAGDSLAESTRFLSISTAGELASAAATGACRLLPSARSRRTRHCPRTSRAPAPLRCRAGEARKSGPYTLSRHSYGPSEPTSPPPVRGKGCFYSWLGRGAAALSLAALPSLTLSTPPAPAALPPRRRVLAHRAGDGPRRLVPPLALCNEGCPAAAAARPAQQQQRRHAVSCADRRMASRDLYHQAQPVRMF